MNGDGNLWMPNQPDVQVYLVDTEEPYSPGGGGIPDGLMEFKVYRDLMHVGTVAYDGEGLEDTIGFVDNPVDPGCYDYTVTAVYDLTDYGFPGQTGESFHEGPDTVCVVWGYDLPFMEAWDSGNFGFNMRHGPCIYPGIVDALCYSRPVAAVVNGIIDADWRCSEVT